jgi:hypothetical protein
MIFAHNFCCQKDRFNLDRKWQNFQIKPFALISIFHATPAAIKRHPRRDQNVPSRASKCNQHLDLCNARATPNFNSDSMLCQKANGGEHGGEVVGC